MNVRLLSTCLVAAVALGSTGVLAQSAGKSAAKTRRANAGVATGSASVAPANQAGAASNATSGSPNSTPGSKDPFDAAEAKLKSGTGKDGGYTRPQLAKATFGAGCFWHVEAEFEWLPGVKSAVSGYAGGNVANPTYEMVHEGDTGHAEVVQVTYDPSVISYEQLLRVFWNGHDPTQWNRQGPDVGTQYRSVILYHNEAQRQAALKSYRQLMASGRYRAPIVTQLVPMKRFYRAEDYHQNYYGGKPDHPVARRTHRSARSTSRRRAVTASKSGAAAKKAGATPRSTDTASTWSGASESTSAASAPASGSAARPDSE